MRAGGQRPQVGQNIRRAGEDIAAGTVVVAAGSRLKPADIGLIALVGQPEVEVLRLLRVAVFFTGDELTEPGETLFSAVSTIPTDTGCAAS